MTRRITCYVVFVTLIWGAHTDDEGKVRDMFKSNMTRNDFSNLLQSLIKLNEQRVSVLQKLYRLEDYGVLSEVLRSGDKKTENGNPSNLYLIVMSKGSVDAKNIVKKYQVLLDDGQSQLAEDKQPANDDEILYELLGLVTLEGNETLTRRNIDIAGNSTGFENESEEDDDIEEIKLRAHDKSKKKHQAKDKYKTKRKKTKRKEGKTTKRHTALRTDPSTRRNIDVPGKSTEGDDETGDDDKAQIDNHPDINISEELKDIVEPPAMRARKKHKNELRSTILQTECINESNKETHKCSKACNRAHAYVCARRSCSVRAKNTLKTACGVNCRTLFNSEVCDT